MSILTKLTHAVDGVVEITVSRDNTHIEFSEGDCGFNCVKLTKKEVLDLAEELIAMAVTLD